MPKPTLRTTGEFLAAARAIAIAEAPQIDELCGWLLATYDLDPAVQQDLILEGAMALVGVMAEDEEIDLPEFGFHLSFSKGDPALWLELASAAVARQRDGSEPG